MIGDDKVKIDEIGDTVPYIADLAKWLDDDSQVHPCNGALAYLGFEISLGILLSGLDRHLVIPPIDTGLTIAERMAAELPDSPAMPEEKK